MKSTIARLDNLVAKEKTAHQVTENVRFSDYLLSRRFNSKTFTRCAKDLQALVDQYPAPSDSDHPIDMVFSMSAKYQTPTLQVNPVEWGRGNSGLISDVLEEYFSNIDTEERSYGFMFEFTD